MGDTSFLLLQKVEGRAQKLHHVCVQARPDRLRWRGVSLHMSAAALRHERSKWHIENLNGCLLNRQLPRSPLVLVSPLVTGVQRVWDGIWELACLMNTSGHLYCQRS